MWQQDCPSKSESMHMQCSPLGLICIYFHDGETLSFCLLYCATITGQSSDHAAAGRPL